MLVTLLFTLGSASELHKLINDNDICYHLPNHYTPMFKHYQPDRCLNATVNTPNNSSKKAHKKPNVKQSKEQEVKRKKKNPQGWIKCCKQNLQLLPFLLQLLIHTIADQNPKGYSFITSVLGFFIGCYLLVQYSSVFVIRIALWSFGYMFSVLNSLNVARFEGIGALSSCVARP